ncbi:MAG: hypothetical protein JW965_09050 [Bacteroidales bacterium]|nr:hypothetical protein [Bacteroidales bacterium]
MERTYGKNMKVIQSLIIYFIISPLALLISSAVAEGQSISDFKSMIYYSYVKGEMSEWKAALSDMEDSYKRSPSDEFLYELLMAQYGYIGFCLKEEYKKEAALLLEKARDNLETLKTKDPYNAEWLALEGAFLGYEMGLHKLKAMVLGPKAKDKIDEAVEKDPERVRTLVEKANQLYFSPKIVGGDPEEAIKYYRKAINKIESEPVSLKNNWIYVNTLLVLAQAYQETDNLPYACAIYEKIMKYDPDIKWVKNDLYSVCTGKTGPRQ